MAQAVAARPLADLVQWPQEGLTRIPVSIYTDPDVYAWEQDRIFRGPTWNFLCLEVEIPATGEWITTYVGDTPVIVVRRADGSIGAFVNRCPHKGATICYTPYGKSKALACPYHNWVFDFTGKCIGITFEKGVGGTGGLPEGMGKESFHLHALRVEVLEGIVFGSFSEAAGTLEEFLGPVMTGHIHRTIAGRKMQILGRYNHMMPNNWKLYVENSRDTYHPSLLHAFFATFKLNRLSAEGGIRQDERNWHHIVFAKRFTDKGAEEYSSGILRAMKTEFGLQDPSLIDQWIEFPDNITNTIESIFPGFVMQQILNSIGFRQTIPRGPDKCELIWTLVAFESDTEEQRAIRVKQSNLCGPSGYVSMEDGAIGGFVQRGTAGDRDMLAVVEMGGDEMGPTPSRSAENSVRGFYKAWRSCMDV